MPHAPLVEMRRVCHFVGEKALLRDIDWRIDPAAQWAILGPNGAGKTTLLKIICGYLWPNGGGQVLRDGEACADLSQWRRCVGWLTSQLSGQIPSSERVIDTVLSGRTAQIGLKRFPGWEPERADEEEACGVLASLGCLQFAQRAFGTLSQGEQQKVLLARARMARHRLLILDEPCAGLDPGAREAFLESMQLLGSSPDAPAMLLVTHHVEDIMPIMNHTLVLKAARVLTQGASSEVIDAAMLSQLYERPVKSLRQQNGRYWPAW